MKRLITIISLAIVLLLTSGAEARKVTTTFKAPQRDKSAMKEKLKTYPKQKDEFEEVSDYLTFMAYDKRTSADKETFFVDNGSTKALKSLELEITYFNTAGKQIHKRTVEISQDFPAKETRKVDIKTWDGQKSFHYVNSIPSKNGSTPYTVKFRVLSFTVD